MSEEEPIVGAVERVPAPNGPVQAEPPKAAVTACAPRRKCRCLVNILLCLLIFACGAVTGGGAAVHFTWKRIAATMQHPEQVPEKAAQRLARVLRLDDAQSAEVKTILEKRFQNIAALRSEIAPRMDEELQSLRDEISAVLRPDQVKRWERLFDTLRPRLFAPGGKGKALRTPAS